MGRQAWVLSVLVFGSVGTAHAQVAPARAPLLPTVPELRLNWPLRPLSYSYRESEVGGYANGPLQLFSAESLWFKARGLQLLTVASSERAFELDCSLTCQPIAQRGLAVEARLLLPAVSPLVSEPHLFVRQSALRTALRPHATGLFQAGFAGAF